MTSLEINVSRTNYYKDGVLVGNIEARSDGVYIKNLINSGSGGNGETGPTGQQGETGPTGFISISGTNYSDYVFWDNSGATGFWNVGSDNVHIGFNAGQSSQQTGAVAIGNSAGKTGQEKYSVAIGYSAGSLYQSIPFSGAFGYDVREGAVAIGPFSGQTSQSNGSVAIGQFAGQTSQLRYSVAIGDYTGKTNQSTNAVAIGASAGNSKQGTSAVAIGSSAGYSNQQDSAVAIGQQAGYSSQGTNAIAIGNQAGKTSQPNNSIVINATGAILNGANPSALYINPIRQDNTPAATNVMIYDSTSKEVTYNTAKTFIIPHPTEESKYLVHGCLEGPEAGVYYRGKAEILENLNENMGIKPINEISESSIEISLPSYATSFNNFSINLTPIKNMNKSRSKLPLEVSEVKNNKFSVYGEPCSFYWLVHATRLNIEVEPLRSDVTLKGDGPYTYL